MPSAEIAMIAVGTAMSVASSAQQAKYTKASLAMQQAALDDEDDMMAIQAMQQEAERRAELSETLSMQQVALAGKGRVTDGSGTTKAIKKRTFGDADRDIKNIKLTRSFQKRGFQLRSADNALQRSAANSKRNFQIASSLVSGGRSMMAARS